MYSCLWEKTKKFQEKEDLYANFFNSENDSEEILKNHKAAISACKTSLKLLNQSDYHEHSRFGPCKCIQHISCPRFTKAQIEKMWKIRLKFLTNENDMLEEVNSGRLNKYIYDVIKSKVFDKVEKNKHNE
jgi:hypothetical protein